ncbi:MAG: DUF4491 family protein [Clostridiales bacterium]|nr:DUF4491 family protein [Clostridiales bacterium]
MNITGVFIGLAAFVIIGAFHPIVIMTEYHFGKKAWPLFLAVGTISCTVSLFAGSGLFSSLLSILGFTAFWSIKELHDQEERVNKGWFPANPKRGEQTRRTHN